MRVTQDQVKMLCELVLCHGFQTDANLGGVEKLSVSCMRPEIGCKPRHEFQASEVNAESASLLPPLHAFMIKGYTRSLAAVTLMVAAWEDADFCKVWAASFLCHAWAGMAIRPEKDLLGATWHGM